MKKLKIPIILSFCFGLLFAMGCLLLIPPNEFPDINKHEQALSIFPPISVLLSLYTKLTGSYFLFFMGRPSQGYDFIMMAFPLLFGLIAGIILNRYTAMQLNFKIVLKLSIAFLLGLQIITIHDFDLIAADFSDLLISINKMGKFHTLLFMLGSLSTNIVISYLGYVSLFYGGLVLAQYLYLLTELSEKIKISLNQYVIVISLLVNCLFYFFLWSLMGHWNSEHYGNSVIPNGQIILMSGQIILFFIAGMLTHFIPADRVVTFNNIKKARIFGYCYLVSALFSFGFLLLLGPYVLILFLVPEVLCKTLSCIAYLFGFRLFGRFRKNRQWLLHKD